MTSDLGNIISTVSAPAPQPAQVSAPEENNTSAQSQNANAANTQNTQTTQSQSASGDNGNTASGSDHFSKLLSAHDTASGTANANPKPASNSPADTHGTSASQSQPTSSASGTSNNSVSITALTALILSQLQSSNAGTAGKQNSSSASSASSASGASNTSSETDTLTQLQQLLAQLQQLAQQSTSDTASASSGSGSAAATPSNKSKAASDTSGQDNSLTQILSQIAALLQQVQQTSSVQAAPVSTDTATAAIASNTGNNDQAALLAQLTRELGDKLSQLTGSANDATSDKANSSGSGSASTNASSASFDATLNALLQSTDGKDALQSALTKVNDLLAGTAQTGKQDTGSNTDSGNNPANAANSGTQAIPTVTPNAQGTQDSAFAKLVSAPAATTPPDQQVLVQIKNAISDGSNTIKIQLAPADLGKVVVQMNTTPDGKTSVSITADNRQTLSMLQTEARSLESSLRDIGVKTGSGGLSFNLSGQQQQQQQTPGKQSGYNQVASIDDTDAEYNSTVTQIYSLKAQQGLDIRV